MHAWEQIQHTIDYIEDHLGEEIQMATLARKACLSPFYFQTLFRRLIRKPVGEYIKLRRLAKATEVLLQDDSRLLDIALALGFQSHEHFTRSFKDTFGMTPGDYRKHPKMLQRMSKPELLLKYTVVDEGVPLIWDGVVLEVRRETQAQSQRFYGLKKRMPVAFVEQLGIASGENPLVTLWEDVHKQKATYPSLDEEEVGVAYPSDQPNEFIYFAGGTSPVENGTQWCMPAGSYIVCSFEAENFEALVMDVLYKAQAYLYNTWLVKHNLHTAPFCIERYAQHSPTTTCMEIWLKIEE